MLSSHTLTSEYGQGLAGALHRPGRWTDEAACRETNPELFFPIGETGPALEQVAEAKAFCARCPVADECLDWALRSGEAHGIWGGATPEERRYMRHRRSRRTGNARQAG